LINGAGTCIAFIVGVSASLSLIFREVHMTWTTPQFEVVDVTMEVTAYVARR